MTQLERLAAFLEAGVSIQVGSRDAQLLPECIRAVGVRVDAPAGRVTVFLPAATADRTMANLRDNGRIAITCARVIDHRTLQLKGEMVSARDGTAEDRVLIDRYRAAFAKQFAIIGIPPRLTRRIAHWPCHVVTAQVHEVFEQTPGPRAGTPLGEGVV